MNGTDLKKMAQAMIDEKNKDVTTELKEETPEKLECVVKCKRYSKRSQTPETTADKRRKSDEQQSVDQTQDRPTNQGKCIWCLKFKNLLPRKKFCAECGSQGCECAYCHRPMPERFYKFSKRLCNACFNKSEKQKAKRRRLTTMGFFSL